MNCDETRMLICRALFSMQVGQSNLKDLLLQCCMDDASDVRQSAFALLGDLARVSKDYNNPTISFTAFS